MVRGPSNVGIGHMVALGNAQRSGAWAWDSSAKRELGTH
jgi:hypothetical protein